MGLASVAVRLCFMEVQQMQTRFATLIFSEQLRALGS